MKNNNTTSVKVWWPKTFRLYKINNQQKKIAVKNMPRKQFLQKTKNNEKKNSEKYMDSWMKRTHTHINNHIHFWLKIVVLLRSTK